MVTMSSLDSRVTAHLSYGHHQRNSQLIGSANEATKDLHYLDKDYLTNNTFTEPMQRRMSYTKAFQESY